MKSKIVYMNPKDLTPDPRNSNQHSEEQVNEIAASISEFGFTNPILIDKDNVLIAGEGRLAAALRLSMLEVPTLCLGHLTENQRRAYAIADNKIARNATWNEKLLLEELEALGKENFDTSLTGFSDEEIASLREMVNSENEAVLEAGKGQGEILDVAGESAGGSDVQSWTLRFGSRKMPLAEDEFRALDKMVSDYIDEYGVPAGFVRNLLGI